MDPITIVTPQFERPSSFPPLPQAPTTLNEWENLRITPKKNLLERGLGSWDGKLMLIPGEWYDNIPDGFLLVSICGDEESFKAGSTDNDIRFGYLAYGINAIDGEEIKDE